uniref:SUEL-type lectin domain-containing protein n=1 Tax=Monopterus albus TaxID=43700 RepID=A0A3Q3J7H7_MONAL|nr:L-rhamnose-binding lectin SML-like isoform X2 [Monopterus albus]
MLRFKSTLLLAATCLHVYGGGPINTVTTCGGIHHLSCDFGVISVETALYGRADSVTCSNGKPQQMISNTQCSLEGAVDVLKRRCNGKRVCELDTNVFATDPCRGTFKYLQTKFTCLPIFHRVTCEHSLAHLECTEAMVLSVFSADYGRWDKTTCSYNLIASQMQNTDCSSSSSEVADSCNGKTSCIIPASNSFFGDPCYGTVKYLEVAYSCEYLSNDISHV